ncbi:hypothetical protein LSCM1_05229 [Leishmania martiniquensis]|uniref:B30.2/SPRY domain-containing protein n=1 Tax=Leishmania martiniquensis TaxID=1580590 RepID=A0A836GZY1_9TRYP|nr:hypothetical protein LSCM1_05229 [Leishmania martiniquensis]
MISDEGFLCALPLGGNDEGPAGPPSPIPPGGAPSPMRGVSSLFSYTEATTPTLYTAQSASAIYPSAYPSGAYTSSAAPASQHALSYDPYAYGSWAASAPLPHSATPAARSAEAGAHAALSEAERQRQILQLERELAEGQRQRLASWLSSSASSASRHSASASADRAASPEAANEAPQRDLSEAPFPPPRVSTYRDSCEGMRDFSMEALAPPSSPSPPSAHVQARHHKRDANAGPGASGPDTASHGMPQGQYAQPSTAPPPSLATPAVATEDFDMVVTVSPQPASLLMPSPHRFSPEPHAPSTEAVPLSSITEQSASVPNGCTRTSPSSPKRGPGPSEDRCTPRRPAPSLPPPGVDSVARLPHRPNDLHRKAADVREDEERLYDAYKQKLARIQEALRPYSGSTVLSTMASTEARRAHERRCRLTTPALRPSAPSGPLPQPPQRPSPYLMNAPAAAAPPSSSPRLRVSGASPVAQRAPSAGSYIDAVAPLPRGRQRPLRWDISHSGNIVVSSDGYVCKADATDALTLIEREYEGRLEDVLHRLVIPFYAMCSLGVTRGSLTFAFRWLSTETKNGAVVRQGCGRRCGNTVAGKAGGGVGARRAPALAYGFATRAFTGYGTHAPAFLYLSTGVIAQGVSTASSACTERPYGASYEPGLELAARLDLEQGELEFHVEGRSMGVAFRFHPARHPAPLFPVVVFSADMDVAELLHTV